MKIMNNWKKYINTVVIILMFLGLNWYNININKKSEKLVTNKLIEMSNGIMLRMNKHALEIQSVKRIIDDSRNIDSEVSYTYAEEIVNTAHRFNNISVSLLTSIIFHESRFNPLAESPAGAKGIGQLMPELVYWVAGEWNMIYTDTLAYDYKFNIRATAWYLDFLYQVPKNSKGSLERTVAYYNGGSKQAYRWELYQKDMNGGSLDSLECVNMLKLSEETKNYVIKVIHMDSVFEKSIKNELPTTNEQQGEQF